MKVRSQISKKYHILILVETGFIIRNLLLGKFIDELHDDIQIIAAVPNVNDPILDKLKAKSIEFIEFPRPPEFHIDGVSRIRRIVNLPNVMYRLVEGFRSNRSIVLQSKVYDSLDAFWFKMSNKILNFIGYGIHSVGIFHIVEVFFYKLISNQKYSRQWKKILSDLNPNLLVSTMLTHVAIYRYSADLPVVLAAHSLNIPCGSVIQSWDNLHTKPVLLPKFLIRYWSWSDRMNQEFQKYYPQIKSHKLKIVGALQFDYHANSESNYNKTEYFKLMNYNPEVPLILFTPGTRTLIRHEDLTIIETIKYILEQDLKVQMMIRLHPKDYGKRWIVHEKFLKENNIYLQYTALDVAMDKGGASSPEEFYGTQIKAIHFSNMVINAASTTAVDAAILGRPIIALGWDVKNQDIFKNGTVSLFLNSTHYKPILETGGVSVVKNKEECFEYIVKYLKHPEYHSREREKIVELVTNKADGKAGFRLARDIEELVMESSKQKME